MLLLPSFLNKSDCILGQATDKKLREAKQEPPVGKTKQTSEDTWAPLVESLYMVSANLISNISPAVWS